jgi:hypothetical protein
MSYVVLAEPGTPKEVTQALAALGYKFSEHFATTPQEPLVRIMGVLAADYLVVDGNLPSTYVTAAMLGAALVSGVKIVVVYPTPGILELVPPAACAFVGSWPAAISEFFGKLTNASFTRLKNMNRRER